MEEEVSELKTEDDAILAQLQAVGGRISGIDGERKRAPAEVTDQEARGRISSGMASPRMTAVIEEQRCLSCGICVDSCPEGAIILNYIAVVEPEDCTGCGICVDECPEEAISLVELKRKEDADPISSGER